MPKDFSIPDSVEVADKEEFGQWLARVTAQNNLPEAFKMNAELLR